MKKRLKHIKTVIAIISIFLAATVEVNTTARVEVSPSLSPSVSVTNATGQSIILRVMYSYQRSSDGPSKHRPGGESAIFANIKIPQNAARSLQIFEQDHYKNRLLLNEILIVRDEHEEEVVEETEEAPKLPLGMRGRDNYEKGRK